MLHKLQDVNNLPDPLKQYQFTFAISKFRGSDGIAGFFSTGDSNFGSNVFNFGKNDSTDKISERFELQCSSYFWPGTKMYTTDVIIGGHHRTRATYQDKAGQWRTTVYETMDGLVIDSIRNWMDAMYNPLTGITLPSTLYISQCEVKFVTPLTHKRAILRGFYPVSISDIQIDASSSKPVQAEIIWNYDYYIESDTGLNGTLRLL
jgi:hypothetical protein